MLRSISVYGRGHWYFWESTCSPIKAAAIPDQWLELCLMTCVLASLVQFSDSPFFICSMSTRTSDMALAHWWCPALVWLHTFLYISFSFSAEDVAWMSCEIDVLFLRLSIYTESLGDLKGYISLHASESHLSYQRRVVGLVWGHLKLTSHQLWLWMFCPFQTWLSLNYNLMSLHF